MPWCIGSDFNVVRFPSEHPGLDFFISTMLENEFSDFTFESGLIDLPMEGGTFTSSNSREVALWSRLDRFLLSSYLEEHFPNIRQKQPHRLLLVCFPILLEGGNFHRDCRPFRFENMWLKAEGSMERVRT